MGEAAGVFGDDSLGVLRGRVGEPGAGQSFGQVRLGELQGDVAARVGAFGPPEQFAAGMAERGR